MSNLPGMCACESLIIALPHRREQFAGTIWKLSNVPQPNQSLTDKKSNIVEDKLIKIMIKPGCIRKNTTLMWFNPINMSASTMAYAYFFGQFGWEFQERGVVPM